MLSTLAVTTVLGFSVQHRPIELVHVAGPGPRVLVVGCIHGNECAGLAVIAALRKTHPREDLWLVADVQSGRARARHAPERARHRPEPELPGGVAAVRAARLGLRRRPAALVGARDPARAHARRADPSADDDLVPPAHEPRVGVRPELEGGPPLRAALRAALLPPPMARRGRRRTGRTTSRTARRASRSSFRPGALTPAAVARQVRAVLGVVAG